MIGYEIFTCPTYNNKSVLFMMDIVIFRFGVTKPIKASYNHYGLSYDIKSMIKPTNSGWGNKHVYTSRMKHVRTCILWEVLTDEMDIKEQRMIGLKSLFQTNPFYSIQNNTRYMWPGCIQKVRINYHYFLRSSMCDATHRSCIWSFWIGINCSLRERVPNLWRLKIYLFYMKCWINWILDKCLRCGVSTDDIIHVSLYKGAGNTGEREMIYAWIGTTDGTIINDLYR